MHHRVCIIGLPRSGSQYVVELIKHNFHHPYTDLVEPYTYNLPLISKDHHNLLSIENFSTTFNFYADRVSYTNNVIQSSDINQSVIMRLFVVPEIENMLYDVIETITKKDYKFIILKRKNIEHHVLSIGIADARNQYKKIWNEPYDYTPVKITNFKKMEWLYQASKNYDNILNENDIDGQTIYYETAIEDLARIYDTSINICIPIKKQVIGDPYDHIVNVDEVRQFFLKLE